ncbi:MAG: hypothetical protein JO334_16015 [Verrucomicrobia bacterium]|nr:hypothetical protein [Verrucomicrobiota bacterium]
MTPVLHRWKSLTPITAVLLAATFVLIFLIIRNCGLFPSVFIDEWTYSEFSRLAPRSQAPVPSYLFFFLFETTRSFGEGFLQCARIYNACFFAIALIFIYAVCRIYASHRLALFIAVLSVLGPINIYSAYFMPESMYFSAFWILGWFLLRNIGERPLILGGGTGAVLGCMAMIKFHAVFLIPGFAAFIFLAWISKSANLTFRSVLEILLFAGLAFIVIRFGGSYLLAGPAGLQFAGERYGSFASPPTNPAHFATILALNGHSLLGHLFTLSFLLSVPLAAIICMDWKICHSASQASADPRLLRLFGLSFLPPLLLITAVSTAMFAHGSPYDTINRLHLRYYSFVFPLFFIIAASEAKSGSEKHHSCKKLVAALILATAGLYATTAGLKQYSLNIVDSPELFLISNPPTFLLSGFLGIISVLVWSIKQRTGAILYLFLFLPFVIASAAQSTFGELSSRRNANGFDSAGRFARQFLGTQTSKLVIVGSEKIGLYEALFNVDNPETSVLEIPPEAPLDLTKMPAGKNWALIIGDHEPASSPQYRISMWPYSLIKFSGDNVIDFRDNAWPWAVQKITGISGPEQFGRWTVGDEMAIEFISPLPKRLMLVLKARAFRSNIGLPFSMVIGPQEQQFRLGSSLQEITLFFQTDGLERTIRVHIPKPTSPKQLWNLSDERMLGAAFEQISISELK